MRHEVEQWFDELDGRLAAAVHRRLTEWRQHLSLLTNRLKHAPSKGLFRAREDLGRLDHRLHRSLQARMAQEHQRLARLQATLNAAHPRRVLERGYTMAQDENGQVLSAVTDLALGQTINLQFADGSAQADIHTVEPKEDPA